MDEGRIGLCRRVVDQHRKSVCILNDIAKTRLSVYNNFLSREQHVSNHRYFKSSRDVRRSVVRQRVLLKCMEMRRRCVQTRVPTDRHGHSSLYGQYNGAPLHDLSRDVDVYIAAMHPRLRRIQRVQRLLQDGVRTGALLDGSAFSRRKSSLFRLVKRPLGARSGGAALAREGSELEGDRGEVEEEKGEADTGRTRVGSRPSVGKLHRIDFSRRGSRLSSRGDNSSPPREEKALRVVGIELESTSTGGSVDDRRGGESGGGDNSGRETEKRESRESEKRKNEKRVMDRRRSKPETGLTFETPVLSRRPTLVLPPIASTRELLRPIPRES